MIFVSVGSLLPFERLVKAADEWAAAHPDVPVHIQIGDGRYEPRHAPFVRSMPMTEYRERLMTCDLFVAHVGMGSILQALEHRKQMLLLPRLHTLGEHTTDHQYHTAARLGHLAGMRIVSDAESLQREMGALLANPLAQGDGISDRASDGLLAGVTAFLDAAKTAHGTR